MAGDATHPVAAAPDHYARAGTESLVAGKQDRTLLADLRLIELLGEYAARA